MLPFSFRGRLEIRLPGDQSRLSDKIAREIELELEKQKPKRLALVDRKIAFVGGIFRPVAGSNLLGPIGRGEVEVRTEDDRIVLAYELDFMQMFLLVTFMVVFFVAPVVLRAGNLSLEQGLALIAAAWAWLFGGNLIIALWRFPRALRRAVSGVESEVC